MKKTLAIILAVSLCFTMLIGCGKANNGAASATPTPSPSESASATPAPSDSATPTPAATGYELALVTDLGTIDDKSFNQGAWEGLKKYATEKNLTYQYYQPSEGTNAAYLEAIGLAVQGGAKVIVTPGFLFEVPIYEAQTKYPEVKFVLLDGEPHTEDYKTYKTESNVVCILYAEEEAGFMAGYAAVKDGFTKLGFMGGMAVPAVIRYGHGYLQGAEAAAKEMKLAEGAITVMYNYSGDFAASPEKQAKAAGWYQSGTEVVFGCGGAVGNSVMAAAEASKDKFVIGVDVDQYAESPTVISSAMKLLGNSVYKALSDNYSGNFQGGKTLVLNAKNDGVGLAMDNAKWRKYTKADYDTLYKAIQGGTYTINNKTDIGVKDLGLKYVKVTEVTD